MKKFVSKFLILAGCACAMASCSFSGDDNNYSPSRSNQFGDFDYKGHVLYEYAVKEITAQRAKSLISIVPKTSTTRSIHDDAEHMKNTILYNYACLTTVVKYFEEGNESQQVRSDMYQGTEFANLLDRNYYEPFGQMNVRYLYVDNLFIDNMEEENARFIEQGQNLVSPFKARYTYHEDSYQNLVIQIHDFAELPASVGGGIGSSFRQDSELVFDSEGKITVWQSSLGLYTTTPTGTVRQGYIFEAEFAWTAKA